MLCYLFLLLLLNYLDGYDGSFNNRRYLTDENIPSSEMDALYDFYTATKGPDWTCCRGDTTRWNFTATANPCTDNWVGLSCIEPQVGEYHISELSFTDSNVVGTIPSSLSSLSYLSKLELTAAGNLTGSIPNSIGSLALLTELYFNSNLLTGSIPPSLGNLLNLEYLSLDFNPFTPGGIPVALGNATRLMNVNLESCLLTGPIPSTFGNLQHLTFLYLNANSLNGSIPSEMGNMNKLVNFQVMHNSLSGTLPSSIFQLTKLGHLLLESNLLTGTLSSSVVNWGEMIEFSLSSNLMTGSLPSEYAFMSKLKYLLVNENDFNGTIPTSISSMTNLLQLQMQHNAFTGMIPASYGKLSQLVSVYLQSNRFTGTLPSNLFVNMSSAATIDIGNNLLSGTMPFCISNSSLINFDVETNLFTGTLPSCLCEITNISSFVIGFNFFSGSLPSCLGGIQPMTYFALNDNSLTGSIPDSFNYNLSYFQVQSNKLTGTIPAGLLDSSYLSTFYVNNNLLTGTISESIEAAGYLEFLILSDNFLIGTLPTAMSKLSSLVLMSSSSNQHTGSLEGVFDASKQPYLTNIQINSNQLTGTIPEEIFNIAGLMTFVATSNCFHGSLPSNVCVSKNLTTLVLNGLSSATSCRNNIFGGISGAYTTLYSVSGQLPACIFELPNISTVQFSGNMFSGSFPNEASLSTSLKDLTVSHNQLSDTIGDNIQQFGNWVSLDLSYNFIGGTLSKDFVAGEHMSLYLENNHLSGKIPGTIMNLYNISILGSNYFTCGWGAKYLPSHDPEAKQYVCASSDFVTVFGCWAFFFGVVVVIFLYRRMVGTEKGCLQGPMFEEVVKQCNIWLAVTESVQGENYVFVRIGQVLDVIISVTGYCTACIMVILLPLYTIFSEYYGTYTYEYAYTLSNAFVSGEIPFAVLLALWITMLVTLLVVFRRNTFASEAKGVDNSRSQQLQEEEPTVWCVDRQKYFVCALLVLINMVVVGAANGLFVYVILYGSSNFTILAQILLSIFKMGWNLGSGGVVLRFCIRLVGSESRIKRNIDYIKVLVGMALMNNIIIPLIVVCFVSPSCFYSVFVPAPTITSVFFSEECLVTFTLVNPTFGNQNSNCLQFGLSASTTTYDPPFSYSYQCTSSFVTYYSPTFLSMCLITTFIVPALKLLLIYLHKHAVGGTRWYNLWDRILPSIYKPLPPNEIDKDDDDAAMCNMNHLIVVLSVNFGLLLTFGVVNPPLAFTFLISIVVIVYSLRLSIGRLVVAAVKGNRQDILDTVLTDCTIVLSDSLLPTIMWIQIVVCCIFYAGFLFDTYGSAVGFSQAYWILVIGPMLSAVLYGGSSLQTFLTDKQPPDLGAEEVKTEGHRPSSAPHSLKQSSLEFVSVKSSISYSRQTSELISHLDGNAGNPVVFNVLLDNK